MTIHVIIVCQQRPLTICPTLNSGKTNNVVSIAGHDNIKQLKYAIQDQLNRGSVLNLQLLDPARQILYDPTEGHELQVHSFIFYFSSTLQKTLCFLILVYHVYVFFYLFLYI